MSKQHQVSLAPKRTQCDKQGVPVFGHQRLPQCIRCLQESGVFVKYRECVARRSTHGLDAGQGNLSCLQLVQALLGVRKMHPAQTIEEVVQTIALISTLSDREKDQNVVTLSTLHASKGLEWPHVTLVGVNEGLLPFKTDDADSDLSAELLALRVQEERRLMYVGITRAQRTLAVSWLKRRKKGRDSVPGAPSRFIKEMALDQNTVKEDPREKLRALRAEFAQRATEQAAIKAADTP